MTAVRIAWLTVFLLVTAWPALGSGIRWVLREQAGQPVMINAPDCMNPRVNYGGIKQITINPATGILYGNDPSIANNGRPQLWFLDSSITSTPSTPVSSLRGTTGNPGGINTNQYTGSVPEGTKDRNGPAGTSIGFNRDLRDGVLINFNAYIYHHFEGFAVQPPETTDGNSTNDWGYTRESNAVSTVAYFSTGNYGVWGDNNGGREAFGYLDKAMITGTGAGEVYRYVFYPFRHSDSNSDNLRICHIPTTFSVSPTDSSVGAWTVGNRPGSTVLMTKAQIEALRPSGTVDGAAVRPGTSANVFDVYMLFRETQSTAAEDDDVTYLTAIQATVPTDGSAMSYTVLDMDPVSTNTWVQLKDSTVDKDVVGTGLAFSADGLALYVAGYLDYSTGNSNYDPGRIYIFDYVAYFGGTVIRVR